MFVETLFKLYLNSASEEQLPCLSTGNTELMCNVGNPVRRVWDLQDKAKFKTHAGLRAEQRRLMRSQHRHKMQHKLKTAPHERSKLSMR